MINASDYSYVLGYSLGIIPFSILSIGTTISAGLFSTFMLTLSLFSWWGLTEGEKR